MQRIVEEIADRVQRRVGRARIADRATLRAEKGTRPDAIRSAALSSHPHLSDRPAFVCLIAL